MSVNVVGLKREALGDGEHVLSSGVKVRISSVSNLLIQAIISKIKDPDPPMWHDEDRGRDVPNPSDPVYVATLERLQQERGAAALDAMMVMGVELLDEMPSDKRWVKKLARLGVLPEGFDEEDEDELLYVYLKYVAFAGGEDLQLLTRSQVTEEDVEDASKSFLGDQTGNPN